MSGIFGLHVHAKIKEISCSKILEDFARSMAHIKQPRFDKSVDSASGVGLARSSLGILNVTTQPVYNSSQKINLIFHGELYNNPGPLSDPEYVLKLFETEGDNCAVNLNGIFHFAVYDKRANVIKLFSDKFGLQPLYYATTGNGFFFSAELKTFLRLTSFDKELDYQSVADFFHYGQILGDKTLFKHAKLLPSATVLTYGIQHHRITLKQYWQVQSLFVCQGQYNPAISIPDVSRSLAVAIKRRFSLNENIGLSLSGGLDSRAILAGLGEFAQEMPTYTLGLPGCRDEKLASQMARLAGTNHEFIELNKDYLQSFEDMAQQMVWLSDGMYHPHESTEMLAVEYFKQNKFKILLRGHGGEFAKAALAYPVMVKEQVHTLQNGIDVLDYIYDATNLVLLDIDMSKLFAREFYQRIKDGARESLIESCGEVVEMFAPADVCLFYYLREHIRRQVVASLEIFRSQIEIRMPFVDEDFLKMVFQLPINQRNKGEMHVDFIRTNFPQLLRIVNSNTGASLNANPLHLFFMDKFQSLMNRMRFLGFRHYTEFERWYRSTFKSSINEILMSNRCLDRGIFETNRLNDILESHFSGEKNYARFLGTAVGIELWFRQFMD